MRALEIVIVDEVADPPLCVGQIQENGRLDALAWSYGRVGGMLAELDRLSEARTYYELNDELSSRLVEASSTRSATSRNASGSAQRRAIAART